MKLFFIVGEDSGDALAAPLIKSMKQKYGDDAECSGIGGPLMKAQGFNELLPMDQISAIGIWEVIPKLPQLLKIKKALIEEIEQQQPDALITVDFPDFNFIIARTLKKRGIFKGKIIHYVAPSVWAWRPGRAKKISEFLDGIMCLFPMEIEYFTQHGLQAVHVGHPLISSQAKAASGDDFKKANDIPDSARTLGLFFGSRESEFKNLSSVLKQAVQIVQETEEDIRIIVPTLPRLEYNVQELLSDFPLKQVYVTSNPITKWQSFKACDVAVAVSGTVGLELAYAEVPHIIAYKVKPITALILKLMVKVKYVHLANILLNKSVVPECLQSKCNPEKIAQEISELFNNTDRINDQKQEFKKLGILLGESDSHPPSERASDFICKLVKEKTKAKPSSVPKNNTNKQVDTKA